MTDVKVDSTSSAENNQTNNVKEKKEKSSGDQKPKSPKGGGGGKDKFDEAALEKEFQAFVGKLKRQYGPNSLAYQISNHPEVSAIFFAIVQHKNKLKSLKVAKLKDEG